jgi:hypothetical protein
MPGNTDRAINIAPATSRKLPGPRKLLGEANADDAEEQEEGAGQEQGLLETSRQLVPHVAHHTPSTAMLPSSPGPVVRQPSGSPSKQNGNRESPESSEWRYGHATRVREALKLRTRERRHSNSGAF